MTSTKIRITIATLAAALSIGAVGGPVAQDADAAKNTRKYQSSSEAQKKKKPSRAQRCSKLQQEYNDMSDAATSYANDGNTGAASVADDAAADAKRQAGHLGCGWAL